MLSTASRLVTLTAAGLALAACDGLERPVAETNETSPPPECVAAVRLDGCCQEALAVHRSELGRDPCLAALPVTGPVPEVCLERLSRIGCAALDGSPLSCSPAAPLSHNVGLVNGRCQWLDECQEHGDCVMAWDLRLACSCAAAYPRRLAAEDPCLSAEGEAATTHCPDAAKPDYVCSIQCSWKPGDAPPLCVALDSGLKICTMDGGTVDP